MLDSSMEQALPARGGGDFSFTQFVFDDGDKERYIGARVEHQRIGALRVANMERAQRKREESGSSRKLRAGRSNNFFPRTESSAAASRAVTTATPESISDGAGFFS